MTREVLCESSLLGWIKHQIRKQQTGLHNTEDPRNFPTHNDYNFTVRLVAIRHKNAIRRHSVYDIVFTSRQNVCPARRSPLRRTGTGQQYRPISSSRWTGGWSYLTDLWSCISEAAPRYMAENKCAIQKERRGRWSTHHESWNNDKDRAC